MRFSLSAFMVATPALVAAILISSAGAASIPGQVPEGREIALRWCASCHQVSDDQAIVNAQAPAFASIAGKFTGEDGITALAAFLTDPHPVMPDMSLSRREIADLVAFIGSLEE
jgi:mono/diheme cytochrome c family protein